jgi:hypothetical protein
LALATISQHALDLLNELSLKQVPQTDQERAVACVLMMIGAASFAYAVSAICAIVASFGEESKEYVVFGRQTCNKNHSVRFCHL